MIENNRTVYLNGAYLPLCDAKVSVLDRGFLFSDGVYEVIPSYKGKLFRLEQHLQRLESSMENIRLQSPHTHQQWLEIFTPLLDEQLDQYIYLQVTRGVAPVRDHAFPEATEATVFAMSAPIKPMGNKNAGINAVTLDDTRWELCHIKATTLLGNVLLRQYALEHDSAEAILVKNGVVTEGAASNLFAVFNNTLVTPIKDNRILPGITREVVLELARQQGIPTAEQNITLDRLKTADEIWLTSSTREILPVVALDSVVIADGKPGPAWKSMHQLFQDYKNSRS